LRNLKSKLELLLPTTPLTLESFVGDYMMTTFGTGVESYVSKLSIFPLKNGSLVGQQIYNTGAPRNIINFRLVEGKLLFDRSDNIKYTATLNETTKLLSGEWFNETTQSHNGFWYAMKISQ